MSEATSQLNILVKVRDEASAALNRLSNDVSDLGGSLNFAGLKAGILAGSLAAIAGATLIKSINAFAESEVKMAKFDAIMRSLPPKLQQYRNQILEAANAAMRFGFDNEESAVSMARLLQATGDINLTMQAFQAAMDLARFRGISLEEATNALILAFQGGGRLLKEFGIDIDEHASKQTILQSVMRATQGQAERYSETLTGMTQTLRTYLREIQEAIGQPFVEFIKEVIQSILSWVEAQGGINALLEEHSTLLNIVGSLLIGMVGAGFIVAASAALTALGPFGLIVAAISAIISVGTALYTAWKTNFLGIQDITKSVVDFIKNAINSVLGVVQSLINALSSAVNAAKSLVSSVGGRIKSGISKIIPFQEGGIVTKPILGMVGEAGPEAIIPLNRLGGLGTGGITINLQGDFYTDMEIAEKFGNAIAKVIKYQLKL